MARTVRTKVYKFDELSDKAKQKVLTALIHINVEDEWWEFIYEDAENIGLKLTGFDIGRGNECTGEFILNAKDCAEKIIENHGETCDTYNSATAFLAGYDNVSNEIEDGDIEDEGNEFLKALLQDYLKMLRDEYEYQTSEEAIIETIIANKYEFTADGRRF